MLDELGLHPWQIERYTGHELRAIERYRQQKAQAEVRARANAMAEEV